MAGGYSIKLDVLCATQNFGVDQVESATLVYPRGAVPNPLLLWVKVVLKDRETRFITLPLTLFYEYVDLPQSNLGGMIDGD